MKKCPYCAEEILDDAKKCKHCNEFLDKNDIPISQTPAPQKVEVKTTGGGGILLTIFLILGIILFVVLLGL